MDSNATSLEPSGQNPYDHIVPTVDGVSSGEGKRSKLIRHGNDEGEPFVFD